MTLNMQGKNGIEWCDATWNPVAGCHHGCRWVMPDGTTAICYAETIAEGMAKGAYAEGFSHHYWKPQLLNSPQKKKEPLKIFVGSMADLFGHWVKDEQIEAILRVARECPQHTFQLLTKNPKRTVKFDLPRNVWVGASMPPDVMMGGQLSQQQKERMLHVTLESLAGVQAAVKWISFEPLSWDVSPIVAKYDNVLLWAVIGAASAGRKYFAPDAGHFRALQDVLDVQEVATFYKGNLRSLAEAKANWREEYPRPSMVEEIGDLL